MDKITWPLLFIALALIAPPALPQQIAPVDSIREATWQAYSHYYPGSPLCAKDEVALWSCTAGKREYSLCASHMVTRTQGYMQYRASKSGKTVFTYPSTKHPPAGAFTYAAYGNGDASVKFSNEGYHYTLVDPLRGQSSILVDAPDGKTTEITCAANQTLQVNYTMRLMYDSGVWDR